MVTSSGDPLSPPVRSKANSTKQYLLEFESIGRLAAETLEALLTMLELSNGGELSLAQCVDLENFRQDLAQAGLNYEWRRTCDGATGSGQCSDVVFDHMLMMIGWWWLDIIMMIQGDGWYKWSLTDIVTTVKRFAHQVVRGSSKSQRCTYQPIPWNTMAAVHAVPAKSDAAKGAEDASGMLDDGWGAVNHCY